MKVMIQGIRAELLKMRYTFLYVFHVAIPLLASSVFLLYYRFSGWSEQAQIAGYMEIIGMALPFLVSIICAGNIGLEEQNHFQVFLGSYENKWKGLAVKWLVLVGMCLMAIAGAVLLFGTGYHVLLGKEGLSISEYLWMILVLFLGSMPLYLEHLFFNLRVPVYWCSPISVVRSVPHWIGRWKMAVFSLYMECERDHVIIRQNRTA